MGLLITVTIIVILSFVLLLSLQSVWAKFRDSKRASELNSLKAALHLYYMDYDVYPVHDSAWCSLEAEEPTDGYGTCFLESDGPTAVGSPLVRDALRPYLSSEEVPGDPLFSQGPQASTMIYSYRYKTIDSGGEYKIFAKLEKGGFYEIYSGGGFVIEL